MSTSTLTKKTAPAKVGTVLTSQEYETLNKMLSSNDEGDHRMAQAILNQCDVQKSIYWIWKLSKKHASDMVYLRTKASRDFNKESNLFPISWQKATAFALGLIAKNWLTEEIYQYLKPEIMDELVARNKEANFYDIHITIKEEYKEYDPEHTLVKL
jgi:hypothetical protein